MKGQLLGIFGLTYRITSIKTGVYRFRNVQTWEWGVLSVGDGESRKFREWGSVWCGGVNGVGECMK